MSSEIPAWSQFAGDAYREIMARRGLDPDNPPPLDDHPDLDPYWSQARTNLAATIPMRFAQAQADHPRVAQWVERFNADPRTAPSLLLTGVPGTGKTHQMLGALRAVVEYAAGHQRVVRYRMVTHPQLNEQVRQSFGRAPGEAREDVLEPYESVHLLLLDDLGAGKQNEWTGDCLYRLVDHRWFNSLPTLYATNLSMGALTDAIGERVVSRVVDGWVAPLTGSDRRRGGAR